jgi:hypothetical protein
VPAVTVSKYVAQCSWEEVPHLTEQARAQLLASIPLINAMLVRGIPSLGSGAIYPVPESEIVVPDQEIPTHWPRAYGLDIGWNRTAAVWGAQDRETGTMCPLYARNLAHRSSVSPAGLRLNLHLVAERYFDPEMMTLFGTAAGTAFFSQHCAGVFFPLTVPGSAYAQARQVAFPAHSPWHKR